MPEIGYRPNEPLKLNSSGSFDIKPTQLTLWCWVQGVSPRPTLSWMVNSKSMDKSPVSQQKYLLTNLLVGKIKTIITKLQ